MLSGEDPETWRRMMEDKQMEEISRREAEIQALQEQRLQVRLSTLNFTRSNCKKQSRMRSTELVLHVL